MDAMTIDEFLKGKALLTRDLREYMEKQELDPNEPRSYDEWNDLFLAMWDELLIAIKEDELPF